MLLLFFVNLKDKKTKKLGVITKTKNTPVVFLFDVGAWGACQRGETEKEGENVAILRM